MATLSDFDRALSNSPGADGDDVRADDGVLLVGAVAAKLSEEELTLLRMIWKDRPSSWQRRCAEVLGSARLDEAIGILLDMVDQGESDVALGALESLREFHPGRFTPEQTRRILVALDATLEGPVGPLHRVVLEAFLATLRSAGSRVD